jgi:hypothetical protein
LLKSDLGRSILTGGLILFLAIVAVWAFGNIQEVRFFYFAAASFHGYFELASLGFTPISKLT